MGSYLWMRWCKTALTVLGLGVVAWLLFWAWQALELWRHDHLCVLVAGPFLPCGPGRLAWQYPMILALLPAALWGTAGALWRALLTLRSLRTRSHANVA